MSFALDANSMGQALHELGVPADCVAYIQHIWTQGATDYGYQDLTTIADILVGNLLLTFPYLEERQQYGNGYSAPSCPRPGLSKEELAQYYAELAARREPILSDLTRWADADHSGFVTTEEAREFRQMVEGGLKVAYLAEQVEPDLATFAPLVWMSRQECEVRLIRYQAFLASFPEFLGTTLVALPTAVTEQLPPVEVAR